MIGKFSDQDRQRFVKEPKVVRAKQFTNLSISKFKSAKVFLEIPNQLSKSLTALLPCFLLDASAVQYKVSLHILNGKLHFLCSVSTGKK